MAIYLGRVRGGEWEEFDADSDEDATPSVTGFDETKRADKDD